MPIIGTHTFEAYLIGTISLRHRHFISFCVCPYSSYVYTFLSYRISHTYIILFAVVMEKNIPFKKYLKIFFEYLKMFMHFLPFEGFFVFNKCWRSHMYNITYVCITYRSSNPKKSIKVV